MLTRKWFCIYLSSCR